MAEKIIKQAKQFEIDVPKLFVPLELRPVSYTHLIAKITSKDGNTTTPNGLFTVGTTDATTGGSRNAFLYQLGVQGLADPSTIQSIYNLGDAG